MFGRAVRICVCARLHLSRTTDPVNLWFVSCVLWVVEVVGGWVDGWAGGCGCANEDQHACACIAVYVYVRRH